MLILQILQNKFFAPVFLSLLFFLIYSSRSLVRHFNFDTHAFDLGIYAQISYLYSQGMLPFSSLKHMLLISDHFGPILLLLSPFYKIFPEASTLLLLQALLVAASAIPLYFVIFDKVKNSFTAFLLIVSYLTSAGIISAMNFDFHLATISVFPLSLIIFTWYFKKWKLYIFSLFFSVLFKEDIPIFIFGLGLFQLLTKQFRIGLLTISFSLISLYLIKYLIMPFFWKGAENAYFGTTILPLNSPADMLFLIFIKPSIFLDIFFNSPVKQSTFNTLYREFAYLPLISPFSWLTAFPSLYLRFSSSYYQTWGLNFHHNANIIPFLVTGAAFTLAKFKFPLKAVNLLLLILLFTGSLKPASIFWNVLATDLSPSGFEYINVSLSKIPQNAAVSAQSPLVPHLVNREKIYMFPEFLDAEFIAIDRKLGSYPLTKPELEEKILSLNKSSYWEKIEENKSLIIFSRRR